MPVRSISPGAQGLSSLVEAVRRTAEAVRTPIGRSVANLRVHVLDRGFSPLPAGIPGELLFVSGMGVGRGYLGDLRKTPETFIPDPLGGEPGSRLYRTGGWGSHQADGVLDFLGRRDGQVKICGFCIELAEIETALAAHPTVRHESLRTTFGEVDGEPFQEVAPGSAPALPLVDLGLTIQAGSDPSYQPQSARAVMQQLSPQKEEFLYAGKVVIASLNDASGGYDSNANSGGAWHWP